MSIKSSANIATAGIIQNNSIAQLKNEYAYSSEENSIKVFYSDDLACSSSAIVATNSHWTIGLAPYLQAINSRSISTILYTEDNSQINAKIASKNDVFHGIKYNGVFDNNISLYYQTTYT